jgi:hypothetical protein
MVPAKGGHEGHPDEVAPQGLEDAGADLVRDRGRHPHVVLNPAADERAVLEQEEQAERGQREEEQQG